MKPLFSRKTLFAVLILVTMLFLCLVTAYASNGNSPGQRAGDDRGNAAKDDQEYTVTILNDSEMGTASASPDHGKTGTKVKLSYSVKNGYYLAGWEIKEGYTGDIIDDKFTILNENVVIRPIFDSISSPSCEFTLKPMKIKKTTALSKTKVKIEWKKQDEAELDYTTCYQIQVSTDKKFEHVVASKRVKRTKTAVTIGGLKKKTKYYVRMRVVHEGENPMYYSPWSNVKSVKTKKK